GHVLGHTNLSQRHMFPATTNLQPQRCVSYGGALLIVGSALLTPALLNLATLHLCTLVEPAARLP
ncbi:MAG TPA: hypothetical protein VHR15_18360, partial [Ktedonobacterales bacterium]|nr:hypothetical protein [Ktedonobacterales bacterium]